MGTNDFARREDVVSLIYLDTSFLIRTLVRNSSEDGKLRAWIRAGEPLGISAIGWSEFLCGPVETNQIDLATQILPDRVPFDETDARMAARFFNETGRRRGSLSDCMIAATAVSSGASLATANLSDFRRLEPLGLKLAD